MHICTSSGMLIGPDCSISSYSRMKLLTMLSLVSISGGWMSNVPPELKRVL